MIFNIGLWLTCSCSVFLPPLFLFMNSSFAKMLCWDSIFPTIATRKEHHENQRIDWVHENYPLYFTKLRLQGQTDSCPHMNICFISTVWIKDGAFMYASWGVFIMVISDFYYKILSTLGSERWLSCEEHLLLLQIWVQFPTPIWAGLQPPVTPIPGVLMSSSGTPHNLYLLERVRVHTHQIKARVRAFTSIP